MRRLYEGKRRLREMWAVRRRRIEAALLAGALGAALLAGDMGRTPVYAWWGTMYPKFCYAQRGDGNGEKAKLSFWLAKVLDW